jgi:dipeptide/tripeptide permease
MSAPTNDANRFPSQARFILGNEAAERYSYYGMKGILALYITNILLKDQDYATNVIHLFGFVNYFMPLLGAWVSDRFWGRYRTILWISLFYCAGHGVLAMSDLFPSTEAKVWCLFLGLGLIAFGSGGIKPCVSAFMGDQFKPEQRHLLPKAYAAFYWCINLGSTAAFLTIPLIRKEFGYSWAFGVPGIAMALATFVFWLGTKRYTMVPPSSQTKAAGFFRVLFHAFAYRQTRQPGQQFWDVARARFSAAEVDAARSVLPILGVFALIPVFWALFDQTFSTWVMQGEQMRPCYFRAADLTPRDVANPAALTARLSAGTNDFANHVWSRMPAASREQLTNAATGAEVQRTLLCTELNRIIRDGTLYSSNWLGTNHFSGEIRFWLARRGSADSIPRFSRVLLEESFSGEIRKCYRVGPEEMLSVNPILVMLFVPVMTLLVYPALGRLATPLRRMSAGIFLASFSFVIVAWLQHRIHGGAQLSILWQFVPYIVLTIAEVLLSTTGLEFAFREAAPSMKSTIMGFWNLTVAVGNLLVAGITTFAGKVLGHGSGHDVSVTPKMFLFYAGLTFVVAILFSIVCTCYRYRDAEAAQGR